MELEHEFTVPVPVDRAWPVLLDVERVAPCMPGATLDSVEGDEFTGRLKVKLGAMTMTYRGNARIVVKDESARTVTMEGSGKEARGAGTASATVESRLHDQGDSTRVTVRTKLNVTGRPAQFGRNMLSEVGARLIDRFATALADELLADAVEEASRQAEPSAVEPGAGDLDTADAAGRNVVDQQGAANAAQRAAEASGGGTGRPGGNGSAPTADPAGTVEAPVSHVPGHPAMSPDAAPTVPQQRPAGTGGDTGGGTEPAATRRATRPRRSEEAINLLEVAGPSVLKRLGPLVGAVLALLTVRYLFRRRRGRHHR